MGRLESVAAWEGDQARYDGEYIFTAAPVFASSSGLPPAMPPRPSAAPFIAGDIL
jgi:hypothetical protein